MSDKSQIIKSLEEMAVLLELKSENPFKIRAFSNASRILQGISSDILILAKAGKLTEIKGIGKGIAEFVTEVINRGQSAELQVLKSAIPPGLLEMLKIPGMGPKKVRAVWKMLDIKTIGELEYACQENRLIDLEGFGSISQEKILAGIELVRKYSERHLLSQVKLEAENLYQQIKTFPGVIRGEIAGSLRRWKETIKDIDIVVSAESTAHNNIMNMFCQLEQIEKVTGKGSTKSSIILKSGINADLRVMEDFQFPYALHHLTGSKEHNVGMREIARKKKIKMNEYGLFDNTGKLLECKTENDIFTALNMSYIPPELRENFGEIQAALNHNIPKLVSADDLRGLIHVHSNYSDGLNSIEELANAAQKSGYEYLVISDHSRSAAYANGLSVERIKEQSLEIDHINADLKDFQILKSIECDILPDGRLDYDDDILASFDLVIASIHSRFQMSEQEATERMLKAIQNHYVTIIGHPTGRLLLAREGYPINMNAVIEAAAEYQISIELNANPHRLDIDWRILKNAKNRGVRVSINPDAHRIEGFDDVRYGIGIARKGWLSSSDVLNSLSVEELRQFARNRHL